ncbi:Cytoplasmic protein [Mycena sanguinolenta]|uniref:Cytoplasmic protein n=1 Tax=Mycena sanguinolenta TaxID=230812 RepID=A0A8H6ZE75_9AGAR|nr:Cytoplasmic protein [Mycena sanguinolenta]
MSLLATLLNICCGSSQSPEQTDLEAQQPQRPQEPQIQQPQAHPQPQVPQAQPEPQPEVHAPEQEKHKQGHHKHKPHKPPQEAKPPAQQQDAKPHEDFPPLAQQPRRPAQRQDDGGGWQEVKTEHKSHPHTPAHSPSPPPVSSSPPRHPPFSRHHSDQNQINQHDAHYMRLRADANAEGDSMARCFSESHEAYARGDGAGAKQLSNEGKEHQAKMNALNKEASDWIFTENNKDSKPGEIDLHGLYVKEAIEHTDRALQEAKARGDSEIHLIVGKGLHSPDHIAKIKPAIEELYVLHSLVYPYISCSIFLCRMQKHQLFAELDPHNAGVLICKLDGEQGGVGPDEIARRLQREDDGCTIM